MPLRLSLLVLALSASACAQETPSTPHSTQAAAVAPGWATAPSTAEQWAPELHSPDGWTFTPAFAPDLRTVYLVRWDAPDYFDPASIQRLFVSTWDDGAGRWREPVPVAGTAGWRVDFPHVSPDGRRFLISTNKPHDGHYAYPDGHPSDDFDLWEADIRDGEVDWDTFRPMAGVDLNRQKTPVNARIGYVHNETSPRLDLDGTLYFWTERLDDGGGRRDIYRAEPDDRGGYRAPELLPFNSRRRESGVAVDPDGRWLIIASEGLGGRGASDLLFVARDGDGWREPVHLGPAVNSSADESSPQLSADGRTLFFTTGRRVPGVAEVDAGEGSAPPSVVFWVDLRSLDAVRDALAW